MSLPETLPMGHHLLLAHARAYRAMKACGFDELQVGIAQQGSFFCPASSRPEDIEAARTVTFDRLNYSWYGSVSWWNDPLFFGTYPAGGVRKYGQYLPRGWQKDAADMQGTLDLSWSEFL